MKIYNFQILIGFFFEIRFDFFSIQNFKMLTAIQLRQKFNPNNIKKILKISFKL